MDLLPLLLKIKEAFLKLHAFILKKFGYKIVKAEDYKDEEVEVDNNYPELSSKCIEEKNQGAKFCWSKKMHSGYEKYFEIECNTRRYFMWKRQFLWIKRNH
ncbi:hypothetical protein Lbir_1302 [Legionella birminghamensis]|uniref:Uncharacterized protein n=1 Tax=Legionella birminghamensis TaxID=28083 RepID=A0A378I7E1_9GAMM|nr:hypothetical protein [Legionella birminghamensis]KTC72527.1 hypothetical protein Lbir_1302 [Legionella birminghamensis]STX30660.1 Uncharacterised protein [Legionella birminghamensis]